MSEPHDEFLLAEDLVELFVGLLLRLELLQELHGCFVGSSMERSTKGSYGRGDAGVKVTQGACRYSGVEG